VARLRLYLDEDSSQRRLVRALRRDSECDVLTAGEANRLGFADESHLQFATAEGRAIYTNNQGDFARLHHVAMNSGTGHAGIIVCTWKDMPPEEQAARLLLIVATRTAEEVANALLFVGRRER
jgi:hypothetical protein